MTRSRMRPADVMRSGASGLRFRRTRTLLSALGIAIGIAALVAVLGITNSSESALVAEIDHLGTNLLTVANGSTLSGGEAVLPRYAAAMATRVAGVEQVAPTALISTVQVYRNDKVPAAATGGLAVRAADPSLIATLGGSIRQGTFLNDATSRFPVTVLGYQVAQTLGIDSLAGGPRIRIGTLWFAVQGILNPFPLAPEIDRSALVGFPEAASSLGYDGHPSRIYVRTDPARTVQVQQLLGHQVDPQAPNEVAVSQPSDVLTARLAVVSSGTQLFLGLGALVLLVGGIGIANVMIVAVLERRSEIGLRRALGATRRHIAEQFLAESAALSGLDGTVGVVLGIAITTGLSQVRRWTVIIPGYATWGGLGRGGGHRRRGRPVSGDPRRPAVACRGAPDDIAGAGAARNTRCHGSPVIRGRAAVAPTAISTERHQNRFSRCAAQAERRRCAEHSLPQRHGHQAHWS